MQLHPLSKDNPVIKQALEIAEKINKKHKGLIFDKFRSALRSELNLSRNGSLKVLDFLLNNKILVKGSVYTKDTVLNHKPRNLIYQFIKDNIGVNIKCIEKELSYDNNPGPVLWHLEMLLKFGLIKKTKLGRFTIVIPAEIPVRKGVLYFMMRNKIQKSIVKLLITKEQVRKTDIYSEINLEHSKIDYRIKKLVIENILVGKDNDLLSVNPEIKELLLEIFKKHETITK